MKPTQKAAMQAAIDAHRWALDYLSTGATQSKVLASIDALRAALAEPAVEAYDHGPQAATTAEALRDVSKWLNERPNHPLDLRHVAMLCAALAEPVVNPPAPSQYGSPELQALILEKLTKPVVEPVAYRSLLASGNYTYCDTDVFLDNAEPLYTAPPPPAEAPLITDEEINAVTDRQWGKQEPAVMYQAHRAYAREIEKAVRQNAGLK